MEQDLVVPAPIADDSKQSGGRGWKIATIVASIVAVCGIGFGVYGTVIVSDDFQALPNTNPIYEGAQSVETYNNGGAGHGMSEITVSVTNGEVACFLTEREAEEGNVFGKIKNSEECSFSGISGEISKVTVGAHGKQSVGNSVVAFLMENGSVYYSDTSEWKKEYTVERYVSEKKAIDVIHVNYNFLIRFSDNSFEYIY